MGMTENANTKPADTRACTNLLRIGNYFLFLPPPSAIPTPEHRTTSVVIPTSENFSGTDSKHRAETSLITEL